MCPWYLGLNNKSVGPLTREEVLSRLRSGQIPLSTLAWREGMKSWEPLSKTELAAADEPAVHLSAAPLVVAAAPPSIPENSFGGFGIRAVALVLDGVLFLSFGTILASCFGIILGFGLGLRGFEPAQISKVANIFSMCLSAGFGFFYYGVLQGALGGSPGKLIVGLRLVRADFTPVGVLRGIARYFAFIFALAPMGLGLLVLGIHPRKQGLHDLLAGTVVVTREGLAAVRAAGAVVPAKNDEVVEQEFDRAA